VILIVLAGICSAGFLCISLSAAVGSSIHDELHIAEFRFVRAKEVGILKGPVSKQDTLSAQKLRCFLGWKSNYFAVDVPDRDCLGYGSKASRIRGLFRVFVPGGNIVRCDVRDITQDMRQSVLVNLKRVVDIKQDHRDPQIYRQRGRLAVVLYGPRQLKLATECRVGTWSLGPEGDKRSANINIRRSLLDCSNGGVVGIDSAHPNLRKSGLSNLRVNARIVSGPLSRFGLFLDLPVSVVHQAGLMRCNARVDGGSKEGEERYPRKNYLLPVCLLAVGTGLLFVIFWCAQVCESFWYFPPGLAVSFTCIACGTYLFMNGGKF
jgi:hypothetical protein